MGSNVKLDRPLKGVMGRVRAILLFLDDGEMKQAWLW